MKSNVSILILFFDFVFKNGLEIGYFESRSSESSGEGATNRVSEITKKPSASVEMTSEIRPAQLLLEKKLRDMILVSCSNAILATSKLLMRLYMYIFYLWSMNEKKRSSGSLVSIYKSSLSALIVFNRINLSSLKIFTVPSLEAVSRRLRFSEIKISYIYPVSFYQTIRLLVGALMWKYSFQLPKPPYLSVYFYAFELLFRIFMHGPFLWFNHYYLSASISVFGV